MGCVSSKQAVSVTPAFDHSGAFRDNAAAIGSCGNESSRTQRSGFEELEKKGRSRSGRSRRAGSKKSGSELGGGLSGGSEFGESGRASSNCHSESLSFRLGNLQKYVEGEQVAAGWPAWLSAVAGEAIHGWVPLRPDAFEKLEKIGQGTYSSVFRARELETGRIVALKKVRFDNFEPESVRFMAREILILRRLDHPNIIKLEGLITSRLSCNIYLVFEYMEHDVTGLLSCPDIKFSESQVKCYLKQLLSGLNHCHTRGVMHRDIKGSNLLVNNEGILKVADFGLANFCATGNRQPLTSRVVTLWYRPPELLLGSTDYGAAVDLWSVGCVFAELLLGKPILQGRTEVEQLHKIFKLCGSPPDDYWKKSKLPHATLFKPQQPYDSCLLETFKDLPRSTVSLIETLLSLSRSILSYVKSHKAFECISYNGFIEMSIICITSFFLESRKKISGRVRGPETRKPARKHHGMNKLAPVEDVAVHTHSAKRSNGDTVHILKEGDLGLAVRARKLSVNEPDEASHAKNASQGDIPFSGPLQVSISSGFAWARRRREDASLRSHSRSTSRGHIYNAFEPSGALHVQNNVGSKRHDNDEAICGARTDSRGHESYEITKHAMLKQWSQLERPDSFDASDEYHSQELSFALYQREGMAAKRDNLGCQNQGDKVEFSGPLLSQSHRVDELLERHERQIRQLVRKSWFQRGKKLGK
ncbi:probable serine/threonine-protein kinase At1g54610 [Carica papaya]|uniref:probable serine/threonine-protein kinase At1g54610 n=1 Tax=Carica papaya TaxID=3649 RepID=UPI000B8CB9A2|nr:probable serine/threonine-protein kinase At1g54610 [Carica papaya]